MLTVSTSRDISSCIAMKPQNTYHHGNLRSELLETAAEMISTVGLEKLTVRALSQRVGVSRTALYRHFADKAALLSAIGEDGFRKLTVRYRSINSDSSLDAVTRLHQIGIEYLEFAVKNPGQYRLMFGHEIMRQKRSPGLTEAARGTFNEFLTAVRAFQLERAAVPEDPLSLAHLAWIVIHGLSSLMIDGQLQIIGESHGLPTLLGAEHARSSVDVRQRMDFPVKTLRDFLELVSRTGSR
jgi:AcrR family transcriptional regulator